MTSVTTTTKVGGVPVSVMLCIVLYLGIVAMSEWVMNVSLNELQFTSPNLQYDSRMRHGP
jgi:hypothetical protein